MHMLHFTLPSNHMLSPPFLHSYTHTLAPQTHSHHKHTHTTNTLTHTCHTHSQEYQDDNPNINIANTNSKQAVYVFRCTRSTIKVSGKVNSIILGEGIMYVIAIAIATVDLVSVPDPNPPLHGSHLVSRAGREGLVNLLHKN